MKQNNSQKKSAGRNDRPRRESHKRRLDYFERRFMTDEECNKLRKYLIDRGFVKLNVPVKYLTAQEVSDLRAKMIANGTLVPLAQRKNIPKEQLAYIAQAQNFRSPRSGNA